MTGNYLGKVIENWGDTNDSKLIRFAGVRRQYETGYLADDLEKQETWKKNRHIHPRKENPILIYDNLNSDRENLE